MKVLKSQVDEAAKRYLDFQVRYGENNMTTLRAEIRYRELKALWEEQNGKKYR
jgi:hypothetical protein